MPRLLSGQRTPSVSIPYSTIKMVLQSLPAFLLQVSIPYSTIKIKEKWERIQRFMDVSIPYSTIKILNYVEYE